MFKIKLMGFHELETREVFYIGAFHAPVPNELDDALRVLEDAASYAVSSGKADMWIAKHDCDGVFMDLCDDSTVVASYEYVPGRPLTFWFGDECHE